MAEYVDITDLLSRKAALLKTDAVVKSPHFSLFQGTHALEIDNDKLDSGMITLSEAELAFDCCAPRSLSEVLWAGDSLLRSIFTWLNNSSLSVTVMSFQYVEALLVNYNKDMASGLSAAQFGTHTTPTEPNEILVHQVLRSAVIGVLYFASICCGLGQAGVVYEEEDINTQNMGLDLLTQVHPDEFIKELQESVIYLQRQFPEDKDSMLLQAVLHILIRLIEVPFYLSTKVSKAGNFLNTSTIDSLNTYTELLRENLEYLNKLTPLDGCISMGIQKRLDNRSPTRQLISPLTEDYSSLTHFLTDLTQIFDISQRKTSHDIVHHALNFANTNHHVLSRALYPMFLIRDDRTILGEEPFHELLLEEMAHFSTCDSETFTTDNALVKQKITEQLDQISIGYFEWFNALNQNPCRQRQHFSRAILTFDNLQNNCEQAEINFRDVFQTHDEFEYRGEIIPALPMTSWLFYMKLDIMIQVVMRGFELELYNSWELHPMYWYAVHLHDHILLLLDRVIHFNIHKLERIKKMKEKLKKKKGDQKQRYKEKMIEKQTYVVPALERSIGSLKMTVVKYEISRGLCHLELIHLDNLLKQGLLKVPDFPFLKSQETLYKFRMKPFFGIATPNCPAYADYHRDLMEFTGPRFVHTQQEIGEVKTKLMSGLKVIIDGIQSESEAVGYRVCKEEWLQWYRDLQRSCIGLIVNIGKETEAGRVVVQREGFHRYFPLVKCV